MSSLSGNAPTFTSAMQRVSRLVSRTPFLAKYLQYMVGVALSTCSAYFYARRLSLYMSTAVDSLE